jgi:hypothetical protein
MLKSKYILLIILFLVGAQGFASQLLCDSLLTDTIELADAEFEAWLEEYAQVTDDSLSVDAAKDSVEKKDFVSLSKEGEEAREREKNELIMSVMKSFKKRSEESGVKSESSDSASTLYSPSVLGGVVEDRGDSSDFQLSILSPKTQRPSVLNSQFSTFNFLAIASAQFSPSIALDVIPPA